MMYCSCDGVITHKKDDVVLVSKDYAKTFEEAATCDDVMVSAIYVLKNGRLCILYGNGYLYIDGRFYEKVCDFFIYSFAAGNTIFINKRGAIGTKRCGDVTICFVNAPFMCSRSVHAFYNREKDTLYLILDGVMFTSGDRGMTWTHHDPAHPNCSGLPFNQYIGLWKEDDLLVTMDCNMNKWCLQRDGRWHVTGEHEKGDAMCSYTRVDYDNEHGAFIMKLVRLLKEHRVDEIAKHICEEPEHVLYFSGRVYGTIACHAVYTNDISLLVDVESVGFTDWRSIRGTIWYLMCVPRIKDFIDSRL